MEVRHEKSNFTGPYAGDAPDNDADNDAVSD